MGNRIFLVRHGMTDLNQRGCFCGVNEVLMNDEGVAQMRSVARRLKDERFRRVYTSDLPRAVQSAGLAVPGHEIEPRAELREMDFGLFEGLSPQECHNRYPHVYSEWIMDPVSAYIPDAEPVTSVAIRVRSFWKEALQRHTPGTDDLIVAHGGPIRIILGDIRRYPLPMVRNIECTCGSITIVDIGNDKYQMTRLLPNVVREGGHAKFKLKL